MSRGDTALCIKIACAANFDTARGYLLPYQLPTTLLCMCYSFRFRHAVRVVIYSCIHNLKQGARTGEQA